MKICKPLIVIIGSALTLLPVQAREKPIDRSEAAAVELTATEAEAIVEARMNARATAKAARRDALDSRAALAEWEAAKSDGTKTIFRRVAPPPAPPVREGADPVRSEPTKAELAEFLRRQADAKPPKNISLSATVYDGEVSEIRLWFEGSATRRSATFPSPTSR